MEIIQATEKDALTVLKLFKECIKDMEANGLYQWFDEYPNLEIITDDAKNGSLFIAIEKEEIVGTVTLNEQQDPEYSKVNWQQKSGKTLVVHRLAVHPQFQRLGIGKHLMSCAEKFATIHKYSSIRLDAYSPNQKAQQFYQSLKYNYVGTVNFPVRELPFNCYEKLL